MSDRVKNPPDIRSSAGAKRAALAIALAGWILLSLIALTRPANTDEGQYLAAARLVAEGWIPYIDFPYLQTPLQPYLVAPVALIAPGWLFIGARLVNSVAIAVAAWLIGRTCAAVAGNRHAAWVVTLLVLASDCVLLGGSVARNDAIPFLFFAAGLERLYDTGGQISRGRAFLAGLLIACAASTKISYGPAAGVAGILALISWALGRRRGLRGAEVAFLSGVALGVLPDVLFFLAAPDRFLFYVIRYSVEAVTAWSTLNGELDRLGWAARAMDLLDFLRQGPLLLLLFAALLIWRGRRLNGGPRPLGIGLMPILFASILGVVLPMPAYRQYVIPMVAPLFIWVAAFGADTFNKIFERRRHQVVLAAMVIVVVGLGFERTLKLELKAESGQRPFALERRAHQIGTDVRAAGLERIAGLDAATLVDSGLPLDRRFATGPFLFRAGNLAACSDAALCPVTYASLNRLDSDPPDAVLTGAHRLEPHGLPGGFDSLMDSWARSRGWAEVRLGGGYQLWLRSSLQARADQAHR
jgi:hypothetical protein